MISLAGPALDPFARRRYDRERCMKAEISLYYESIQYREKVSSLMKPRPYRLGQRQTTIEQTRARIVAAARELLATPGGIAGFTIDAVAAQAGVARMTVYNQFASKIGLLEALFD